MMIEKSAPRIFFYFSNASIVGVLVNSVCLSLSWATSYPFPALSFDHDLFNDANWPPDMNSPVLYYLLVSALEWTLVCPLHNMLNTPTGVVHQYHFALKFDLKVFCKWLIVFFLYFLMLEFQCNLIYSTSQFWKSLWTLFIQLSNCLVWNIYIFSQML